MYALWWNNLHWHQGFCFLSRTEVYFDLMQSSVLPVWKGGTFCVIIWHCFCFSVGLFMICSSWLHFIWLTSLTFYAIRNYCAIRALIFASLRQGSHFWCWFDWRTECVDFKIMLRLHVLYVHLLAFNCTSFYINAFFWFCWYDGLMFWSTFFFCSCKDLEVLLGNYICLSGSYNLMIQKYY